MEQAHVYDTLLLGGSLFSLGYASACQNTLILETTEALGAEFVTTFRPAASAAGEDALSPYFLDFNLLHGNRVNTSAMQPILCKFAVDQSLNIMLRAKVLEVKQCGGIYEVQYFTNSGLRTAKAKKIIDTTARGLHNAYSGAIDSMQLRALCISPLPDFEAVFKAAFAGGSTDPGFTENEYIVSLPFPAEADFHAARAAMIDGWATAFANDESVISIICFTPDYLTSAPPHTSPDGIVWIPQAGADPLASFRTGAAYEKEATK